MDDVKSTSDDDEFHFSEAEETNAFGSGSGEGEGAKKGGVNRRNLLLGIGIIVVALSVYKLVGVFFGSSGTHKKTPSVSKVQRQTSLIPQASLKQPTVRVQVKSTPKRFSSSIPISISSPSPTTRHLTTSSTSALQLQLAQMTEHDTRSRAQSDAIKNNLASLSNSVANVQDAVVSMNQQLQTISSQLQQQHAAIKALQPKKRVRRVLRKRRYLTPQRPKWYVQAILPGRAWLFSNDGKNITVTIGDRLAGYGKIKIISINGVVKTSTGAILRFRGL